MNKSFGAEFLSEMQVATVGGWAAAEVSGEIYLSSLDHRLAGGFDCMYC